VAYLKCQYTTQNCNYAAIASTAMCFLLYIKLKIILISVFMGSLRQQTDLQQKTDKRINCQYASQSNHWYASKRSKDQKETNI